LVAENTFNATRGEKMHKLLTGIIVAALAASFSFAAQAESKEQKQARCKREAFDSCRPHCTKALIQVGTKQCMKRK
jgi:hypothetical protein